jgi:hypothetical protein
MPIVNGLLVAVSGSSFACLSSILNDRFTPGSGHSGNIAVNGR